MSLMKVIMTICLLMAKHGRFEFASNIDLEQYGNICI